MKQQWKLLLICLAVPLGIGGLAALLTRSGMQEYITIQRPPLSPPGWVFPVVWTILYLLMGYASYLVLTSDAPEGEKQSAIFLYGAQLLANFLWPLLFFGLQWYFVSFLWIILLWVLIYLTLRKFSSIRELSGDLLLPYIVWVLFAAYLNLGVYLLN